MLKIRNKNGTVGVVEGERGAAGLRGERGEAEHRAEGAATGDHDLRGRAIFFELHHAAGNDVRAGGARPAVGGGDFPHCAPAAGEPAGGIAEGSAGDVAREQDGRSSFRTWISQYRVEAADENAGRGLTIQYLHCSEVSRWPGDAAATLAALRAAVPPDGEIVLESTANGACGLLLRRVAASGADGLLAALLSVVVGAELQARGGDRGVHGRRAGADAEVQADGGTDRVPA